MIIRWEYNSQTYNTYIMLELLVAHILGRWLMLNYRHMRPTK